MNFMKTKKIMLDDIDNSINKTIQEYKNKPYCKKGCDECCNFVIPVSLFDVKYLLDGLNKLDNNIKLIIANNIENINPIIINHKDFIKVSQYEGIKRKCPFLIDSKCSIYEYRPISCRIHFSSTNELCKENKADISFKYDKNIMKYTAIDFLGGGNFDKPKAIFLHESVYYDTYANEFIENMKNVFEF